MYSNHFNLKTFPECQNPLGVLMYTFSNLFSFPCKNAHMYYTCFLSSTRCKKSSTEIKFQFMILMVHICQINKILQFFDHLSHIIQLSELIPTHQGKVCIKNILSIPKYLITTSFHYFLPIPSFQSLNIHTKGIKVSI